MTARNREMMDRHFDGMIVKVKSNVYKKEERARSMRVKIQDLYVVI